MENINDLLKHRTPVEPPEIAALKNYVKKKYQEDCTVKISPNAITLYATSGPFAATLQMEKNHIIKVCELTKPLNIQINA